MRVTGWLQYRPMHNHRFVRRVAVAALALSVGVVPFLGTSDAQADEISDLQARADQISTEITELQDQVVADTAAVEIAVSEAAEIEQKIDKASAQLEAAKKDEAESRSQLAGYALDAYINGGDGSVDLAVLLDTDSDQLGPRQGYQSTAVGNRQELVDQLQASQRVTAERAATLETEQQNAEAVAEQARAKRASAEAAQQELEQIHSQLKGKVATLVAEKQAAEQRAREQAAREAAQRAEQQRSAERAAAAQAAAEQTTTTAADTAARPSVTPAPAPAPSPTPAPTPAPNPPQTTPPPSGGGGSGAGARAVSAAASQLGVPYLWGGTTPAGFDCSGLTQWAWAQAGVSLPRVTYAQKNAGRQVPISALQPGDLVFYSGFGHVALYAGGGSVIHAPQTGDVVKYSSLYMSPPILAVRPG